MTETSAMICQLLAMAMTSSNHSCQHQKRHLVYTLLTSRGAILNIKFLTSFAESNLSSWADFITLIAGLRPKKTQEYKKMTERGYCWYYLDHCSKRNHIEIKGVIKRANTKTFLHS